MIWRGDGVLPAETGPAGGATGAGRGLQANLTMPAAKAPPDSRSSSEFSFGDVSRVGLGKVVTEQFALSGVRRLEPKAERGKPNGSCLDG